MEEILIKSIDIKESGLVIVKFNGGREATLNTKWQEDEVNYLQNSVGIGGAVNVEIQQKGKYINITKVDLNSGKPNANYGAVVEKVEDNKPIIKQEESGLMSQKDISIVSQVCLKGAVELAKDHKFTDNEKLGEFICMAVNELIGAYKVGCKALE